MLGAAILPLLVVGGIGIHLEEAGEVEMSDALAIVARLAAAVGRRTGQPVRVDDPVWATECAAADRCVEEIRSRTGSADLVLVRVLGSATRVRLIAERHRPGQEVARAEHDLPRDPEGWDEGVAHSARELFEAGLPLAPAPEPLRPPTARADLLPWILFGAGVIAAGTGVLFGLSSASAGDRIDAREILLPQEIEPLRDRMEAHGTAANVLFGAAAVSAGAALMVVLFR